MASVAWPFRAQHATFVLSILSLAPTLSSPREVPQIERTRPRAVLKRGKKMFLNGSFANRRHIAHMFNHRWSRLAVGGW